MSENDTLFTVKKLIRELEKANKSKYLTAKQAQEQLGINAKTLLNRSILPMGSRRYIPSFRLRGGKKKYFERKVLENLLELAPPEEY